MKALLGSLLILSLTGCQILAPQIDKAAAAAGKAVTFYCDNIADSSIRDQFRAKVNAAAAPNSVMVTCANGGPVLKSSN